MNEKKTYERVNEKKTCEITIKVDLQTIEDIAHDALDQISDNLGDSGLPRQKELFELVLNAALKEIDDYLY